MLNKIADRIYFNLKKRDDEVMLLNSENDKLASENNKLLVSYTQAKRDNESYQNTIDAIKSSHDSDVLKLKAKIDALSSTIEDQVVVIREFEKASDNKFKNSKLKEKIIEQDKEISKYKRINKSQLSYIDAVNYISDKSNIDNVKEVISHNLSKFLNDKKLNNVEAAKLFGTGRNSVAAAKTGARGLSIDKLQKYQDHLCSHFKCDVFDIVSKKL